MIPLTPLEKRQENDGSSASEEEWTMPKAKTLNQAKNNVKPDPKHISLVKET